MKGSELDFDIELNETFSEDNHRIEAEGFLGSEKIFDMSVSNTYSDLETYNFSFNIDDIDKAYRNFIDVASTDGLRESDNIHIMYFDKNNEMRTDTLNLHDPQLPRDLKQLHKASIGGQNPNYHPSLSRPFSSEEDTFNLGYNSRSEELYENLESYIEVLHTDKKVSENSEEITDNIKTEIQSLMYSSADL